VQLQSKISINGCVQAVVVASHLKSTMIPITLRLSRIALTKCFSISAVYSRSHYESLGLTPHATQADIKSAYYKMSMEFHPDKNKGSEEAAEKFRAITEAYEVLGNLRLKKLYDKGILHTAGTQFARNAEETTQSDSESKFYKSREQRSKAPPPAGKTPIYNFDEWTYMHYGAAFARREEAKARYARKVRRSIGDKHFIISELLLIGVTVILTLVSFSYIKNKSYDVVDISEEKNDTNYPSNSVKTGE
jgi:DnaJ-class molecular chaperone with C-terminal Zn finger domain